MAWAHTGMYRAATGKSLYVATAARPIPRAEEGNGGVAVIDSRSRRSLRAGACRGGRPEWANVSAGRKYLWLAGAIRRE